MRMIGEMDLSRGTKLPREEELARILGVSRTTVRQALNDLAADGIVLRRQGRGTFVNAASRGIRGAVLAQHRAHGRHPRLRLRARGAPAFRARGEC